MRDVRYGRKMSVCNVLHILCSNAFVLMKYHTISYENMTDFMFLKVMTLHLLVLYSITHGMRTESVGVLHF